MERQELTALLDSLKLSLVSFVTVGTGTCVCIARTGVFHTLLDADVNLDGGVSTTRISAS